MLLVSAADVRCRHHTLAPLRLQATERAAGKLSVANRSRRQETNADWWYHGTANSPKRQQRRSHVVNFNLRNDSETEPDVDVDTEPRRSPLKWIALALFLVTAAGVGIFMLRDRPEPARRVETAPAPSTVPAPRPQPVAPEPATPTEAPSPRAGRAKRAEPVEVVPEAVPEVPSDSGSLEVDSDVAGASVFVDREFQGQAPLTIPKLSLGSHQVNVSAEGYDGIARKVDIAPGSNTMVARLKDVTLDTAIPVVHRHGMGSCEGRLVATIDGLKYQTSNRQDAFSVSFAELTRFDVDYLKKNLRIERRGGRSYNFTDKQSNADALFVFHRDVDKARSRLAASSTAQ